MRKNDDCRIEKRVMGRRGGKKVKKPMRLTTRGKQTAIVVLTVMGCILGVMAATVITEVCSGTGKTDSVMACEKEAKENTQNKADAIPVVTENLKPEWLYYQSYAGHEEGKSYLDRLVNSWTKGQVGDDELSEQMRDYFQKQKISITSIHVQSRMLCLFPSANELPDYTGMLRKEGGLFVFIGVYSDGQSDEEGRLMCYYWEAGVQ